MTDDPDRVILRYGDGSPMLTARQYREACEQAQRRIDAEHAEQMARLADADERGFYLALALVALFVLLSYFFF